MQYENAEGYPPYRETDDKGFPMFYPMFGYPQTMLDMAIARDDTAGFQFYFDRYFRGGFEIFGSSETLDAFCERKGAKAVAAWLRKDGCTEQSKVGKANQKAA